MDNQETRHRTKTKEKNHITVKVNKVINRNPHQKAGINPGAHKA
jgi:hypothetical protein